MLNGKFEKQLILTNENNENIKNNWKLENGEDTYTRLLNFSTFDTPSLGIGLRTNKSAQSKSKSKNKKTADKRNLFLVSKEFRF